MKSVTYAMCSHEFREAINGIIKNVELLEPYVDFNNGIKYYNQVCNETRLMLY